VCKIFHFLRAILPLCLWKSNERGIGKHEKRRPPIKANVEGAKGGSSNVAGAAASKVALVPLKFV
jgi:hypothetical protein